MSARDELDKQQRIEELEAERLRLIGETNQYDEQVRRMNETLGLRDAEIEGRAREQRELQGQLDRAKAQLGATVEELERVSGALQKYKEEDAAEQVRRAEEARQQAMRQQGLDEMRQQQQASKRMFKSQVFLSAIFGVLVGLFFLFGRLFWGFFPGWPIVIGTVVGFMILVGLIPQIFELLSRILPQLRVHKYVAVVIPAVAVGLAVALLGVKHDGTWTWFLAFMVTLVGYALMVIFETWGIAVIMQNATSEVEQKESTFQMILSVTAVVTLFSFILAFFVRPVTRIFGYIPVDSVYGPALHLANTLLTTIGLMALIGLTGFVVWFGVKVFASFGLLFQKQVHEMRRYTLWDWISMVVLVVASILVGVLVVIGLWPMDKSDTTMKIVSAIIGVLSCVGFGLIKSKLLKAGRVPGAPWVKVFLLSVLVVMTTGYVSLGTLYKAASQKERFNALITRVHQAENAYFNLVNGQAMNFAKAATTQKEADKYVRALEGMKTAMQDTLQVTNNRELRRVVTRFSEHASVVAVAHEMAPQTLNKVKVPPEPSANALLAHMLGFAEAPRGVERKYSGAFVKAIAAWTLAEFMVLIVFFILLAMRGKEGSEVDDDGYVVSDMNGTGTRFLVFVRQGANHVDEGDQATVYNTDGKIVGSLDFDKAMGDGVVLMGRQQAKTVIARGDVIRFV